ncbi:hypothetical protein ABD91_25865 [Lysinibacillus sphaericus]|uniref:hypothetical protein n=1 Tax=Lysinibacillus sphaericus TaxID=1421 RepID=UPI0018CD278B|nr:hypothetical protein [Lysinibacillus sphaericus]MBG9694163.1 hypothetical protein [Lysinibacillus sphaericus]
MKRKIKKTTILMTTLLASFLLFGCTGENNEKYVEYDTKNPIELIEGGSIDDIKFNLHSISGDSESKQQINLMIFQNYTNEEIAKFVQAYANSVKHLNDRDVRVDIYDGSTIVITEDVNSSELKGVPLLYVYEDKKLYKQGNNKTQQVHEDKNGTITADPSNEVNNEPTEQKVK